MKIYMLIIKDLIDKFIKLFNNLKRKEDGVEQLSMKIIYVIFFYMTIINMQ